MDSCHELESLEVSSSGYAYAHRVNIAEGTDAYIADDIRVDAAVDVGGTNVDVDVVVDVVVDVGVDVDVAVASVMQEPTHPCRN